LNCAFIHDLIYQQQLVDEASALAFHSTIHFLAKLKSEHTAKKPLFLLPWTL